MSFHFLQVALAALLHSWRSRLRQPGLRFEIIQLPPSSNPKWGAIRRAQQQVPTASTHCACRIGAACNLHPLNE